MTNDQEKTPVANLEDFAREHASKLDCVLERYAKRHTMRAVIAAVASLALSAIALILVVNRLSSNWHVILFDLCVLIAGACYAVHALDDRDRAVRARQSDDIRDKCAAYVSESDDYDWNAVYPITDALEKSDIIIVYRAAAVGEIVNRDRPAWRVTLECETFDHITPTTFIAPRLVCKGERFALRYYDVVFDPRAKSLDIRPLSCADWVALDPSNANEAAWANAEKGSDDPCPAP